MLEINSTIHLLNPAATDGAGLLAGKIIQSDGDVLVAEMEQPVLIAPGADVLVFGLVRTKFYQQAASVLVTQPLEPTTFVAVRRVGAPILAEKRGTYRVCTVNSNLSANMSNRLGTELGQVMDLSPEGFAVIVNDGRKIGDVIQIAIEGPNGASLGGAARFQTIKRLPSGRVRYGLLALDAKGPLRRGLEKLTSVLQREQLQRMSRSA